MVCAAFDLRRAPCDDRRGLTTSVPTFSTADDGRRRDDHSAAEERLQRLQLLTGALSRLLSARDAAAIVATQGRAAVGASAVAVFLRDGDELEIAGYDGYELEDVEPYCRIPLAADLPAAEAARTGEPLFLSGAEVEQRFPRLARGRRLA